MSDDTDKESKTEDATEKKIRDALDKGNMPFSRETPILAGIASFLVIAVFVAAPATTKLAVFLRELMDRPEDWTLNSAEDASHLFGILALSVGAALIPVFIIIPPSKMRRDLSVSVFAHKHRAFPCSKAGRAFSVAPVRSSFSNHWRNSLPQA
jgi:flagellar biosynthesis protein FlhB